MLLLLFGTHAHLLSPEEGSYYILSTRNNCCESLAFYDFIFESDFQPYVFDTLHTVSHLGIRANTKLVRSRFIWPSINKDGLGKTMFSMSKIKGYSA